MCWELRPWERILGTFEMSGAMGKAGIGLLLRDSDNGDYLEVMRLYYCFESASASL